jgi:hypothetical protein
LLGGPPVDITRNGELDDRGLRCHTTDENQNQAQADVAAPADGLPEGPMTH